MQHDTPRSSIVEERPLDRATSILVVLGAAATLLLFYAAAFASIVVLAVVVLVLMACGLTVFRFVLPDHVGPHLERHLALLRILARSLWLSNSPVFRFLLLPADAPRLFAMLRDLCGRMGVEQPYEVSIEMQNNAWVQLKGYRRGRGQTNLGVGYDLLAGLTEAEVETVLAHEMAHAKLVQRGVDRWLNKGHGRLALLCGALSEHSDECRRGDRRSVLADSLFKAFDAIASRSERLVATHSRQHEFEADREAAVICGGMAVRSRLTRVASLNACLARLPWSERVARVQPGESFSRWLMGEIARQSGESAGEVPKHAVDHYSTHPSLRDRIAALPTDGGTVQNTRPGIELLAEPDRVAERLTAEIQRETADLEARGAKELVRSTRIFCIPGRTRPLQWLGVLTVVGGQMVFLIGLFSGFSVTMLAAGAVAMALGVVAFRGGGYRDRIALPVPAFGPWMNSAPPETAEDWIAAEAEIEAELRERIGNERKKRDRLAAFVKESYEALGEGDYLRARVAAHLGLEVDEASPEAVLGHAIGSAGLGASAQSTDQLTWLRNEAGLRTRNNQWGTAWASTMLGDWSDSTEGLLAQLHDMYPGEPTFASLLARAQLHRGKSHSAIRSAEKACALEPANTEHTKLLASGLLDAGRAREAAERLKPLEPLARLEPDLMLLMVRVSLMLRDRVAAREWAEYLNAAEGGQWLVRLGLVFESARIDDEAVAFFNEALREDFYPEAHVGLARIDASRGDLQGARVHLLATLNFDRPVPEDALTPDTMFYDVLAQLNALGDRREACMRWIATMPSDPSLPLAGRMVVICATSQAAAEEHLQSIASAIKPDAAPVPLETVHWCKAPMEQQPVRPMHAGVEQLLN